MQASPQPELNIVLQHTHTHMHTRTHRHTHTHTYTHTHTHTHTHTRTHTYSDTHLLRHTPRLPDCQRRIARQGGHKRTQPCLAEAKHQSWWTQTHTTLPILLPEMNTNTHNPTYQTARGKSPVRMNTNTHNSAYQRRITSQGEHKHAQPCLRDCQRWISGQGEHTHTHTHTHTTCTYQTAGATHIAIYFNQVSLNTNPMYPT